jgi:Tol biopolymer transport system component
VALAVTSALVVLLAIPARRHMREVPPAPPAPLGASWTPPGGVQVGIVPEHPFGLAVAPDGRRVAFVGARAGEVALWLHDLRTGRVEEVPGTGAAAMPFWSPDGLRIGFFVPGAIRAIAFDSSAVTDIVPVEAALGAAWNAGGDLVYAASPRGGLQLRSADGATRPLTWPHAAGGESHILPVFMDDGRHVLFYLRADAPERHGVWLASLDDSSRTARLTPADANALFASGHVIYASDDALLARRIDVERQQLAGPVTLLGVGVGRSPLGQLSATVSPDMLIYAPPVTSRRELVWVTRAGDPIGAIGAQGDIWNARIAPDGRRVAATVVNAQLRTLDVVLFEGPSPVPRQLSLSTDADDWPAWSPDGFRVAWTSARRAVIVRGAGAELPEEVVARFDGPARVSDWTPDGRGILVTRTLGPTRDDIWLVPARGEGEPRPLVATPFADVQGTISPDSRWLAYASDESGQLEIYLERLADRSPEPGTRVRVTSGGGSDPRWRRDGRELFFRRGSEIHVATLAPGRGQNELASTSMLFDTEGDLRSFDAAPDGLRFLLNLDRSPRPSSPATLIVHWASMLGGAR